MRPINPPSLQKVNFFMYAKYVTKWVEAKALPLAMEQAVEYFNYEDTFINFGVPEEILNI